MVVWQPCGRTAKASPRHRPPANGARGHDLTESRFTCDTRDCLESGTLMKPVTEPAVCTSWYISEYRV